MGHNVLCLQSTDLPEMINQPKEKWGQLLRKRLKQVNIGAIDTLLIPANVNHNRWALVVVEMNTHTNSIRQPATTLEGTNV